MTLDTVELNCPHCRLTIAYSARWSPEFCPRCLARSHVAVRLSSSPSRPTSRTPPQRHRAHDTPATGDDVQPSNR